MQSPKFHKISTWKPTKAVELACPRALNAVTAAATHFGTWVSRPRGPWPGHHLQQDLKKVHYDIPETMVKAEWGLVTIHGAKTITNHSRAYSSKCVESQLQALQAQQMQTSNIYFRW
jgi:hypothetical protein